MRNEWNEKVAIPKSWIVTAENLEMVPKDFPLERTHREIHDTEAGKVATRISDALRKLSIQAEFDGEKAKAKCQTQDFVSFRIRLYAGGMGGQPVIVEVQRRSGGGMSFMQSCRAILGAAEGAPVPEKKEKLPFLKKPVLQMKCLSGVIKEETGEVDVYETLTKISSMLKKDHLDENVLGLEDLCNLTDTLKTAPNNAITAAKCVVLEDQKVSVRDDIGVVFARCADPSGFDASEGGTNYPEKLRHLCLKAFSNSLALTAQAGSLEEAIKAESWFCVTLIPLLLEEVKDASPRPNNAYIATSCISTMISCSGTAVDRVMELDGSKVLENAAEVGNEAHELLASEAGRCMDKLEAH